MSAIVGVLLSYASLAAGVDPQSAEPAADICALGDACEMTVANEEATVYATPVEVDCRAMSGAASTVSRNDLPLFSGCSQPPGNLPYRVSRFPDSERSPGGFVPERRRRVARSAETCTGLPPAHGSLVSASSPPIAIYAFTDFPLPALVPALIDLDGDRRAPNRIGEPPDRPPRA